MTKAFVETAKVEVVLVLADVHSLRTVHSVVRCFRSAGQYQATKCTNVPTLSFSQLRCDCCGEALALSLRGYLTVGVLGGIEAFCSSVYSFA